MRLGHSSSISISGMSSADLKFLFSVKTEVSCYISVEVSSDLSFCRGFFVNYSATFTCIEEDIVNSLAWIVSIFSTIDKEIFVSALHIDWVVL
eukprot:IDg9850t1